MIKVYSNQNLNNQGTISSPKEIYTTEQEWWMVYDADTKDIVVEPIQCSGNTSSPLTMVVADTKEELEEYITENGLVYSSEKE